MQTYKVGFVGVRRGGNIVEAMRGHRQCRITALCDVNPEALAETGRSLELPDDALYERFEDFVNAELDVIVVATPIEHHAQESIDAMQAGKHVLCEQTAAYSIEDLYRIIDTARRTGRTYMMAENYSFYHCILQWKKLIDAGRLGKVYHAEGEYVHEIVNLLVDPGTGERLWRYPRPPIYYCGHSLGPLLFLLDDRVVRATGVTPGHNMHPDEQSPSFLDMEAGLFLTDKGTVIKILASQTARRYRTGGGYLTWYSLYGTKGFVETGRDQPERGFQWLEGEDDKRDGARPVPTPFADPDAPPEASRGGHGTSEYQMLAHFIDALNRGVRPPFDAVQAAEITAAGIVAHESAVKGGVWLDVPRFAW